MVGTNTTILHATILHANMVVPIEIITYLLQDTTMTIYLVGQRSQYGSFSFLVY